MRWRGFNKRKGFSKCKDMYIFLKDYDYNPALRSLTPAKSGNACAQFVFAICSTAQDQALRLHYYHYFLHFLRALAQFKIKLVPLSESPVKDRIVLHCTCLKSQKHQ